MPNLNQETPSTPENICCPQRPIDAYDAYKMRQATDDSSDHATPTNPTKSLRRTTPERDEGVADVSRKHSDGVEIPRDDMPSGWERRKDHMSSYHDEDYEKQSCNSRDERQSIAEWGKKVLWVAPRTSKVDQTRDNITKRSHQTTAS